jgi:hypothetical protein
MKNTMKTAAAKSPKSTAAPTPLDERASLLADAERRLAEAGFEIPAKGNLNDVQVLLESIFLLLTNQLLKDNAPVLWSLEKIAEWYDVPFNTAKLYIITRPGFPNPTRPTGKKGGPGKKGGQQRWFADDVIAFARDDVDKKDPV